MVPYFGTGERWWRAEGGGKSARGDDALYGAGADAEFAGYLQDAVAFGAEPLDAFLELGSDPRPSRVSAFRAPALARH